MFVPGEREGGSFFVGDNDNDNVGCFLIPSAVTVISFNDAATDDVGCFLILSAVVSFFSLHYLTLSFFSDDHDHDDDSDEKSCGELTFPFPKGSV